MLPEGWRVKGFGTRTNNKYFLSFEATYFRSSKQAQAYISSYMSEADLARFVRYAKGESKVRTITSSEWEDDPTLPKGWKTRDSDAKKFFLAPTNEQFPVRRLVLKFMVEKGYPKHQVELTRKSLAEDGWRESPLLPDGWRFRANQKTSYTKVFLTKEGAYFKSMKTAREFAETNCTQAEVTMLDEFAIEESRKGRMDEKGYNWEEDESLPKGWKLRHVEGPKGKVFFLAPNGDSFPTRQSALRHMIEEGYSKADVELTRSKLVDEGWKESPLLPLRWRFRPKTSEKKLGVKDFLTSNCKMFKSFKTAREFAVDNCTPAEVSKLDEFSKEDTRKCRLEASYNWLKDKSLPEGWKLRHVEGPKGWVFYLAPNGDSFPTRVGALRFLIENKMSLTDIEQMRDGLHSENWHPHKLLPEGWRMRSNEKTKNTKVFLTRDAKFISGYKQARVFIEESKELTKKDLLSFEQLMTEESLSCRGESYDWVKDQYLPIGWKYRRLEGVRQSIVQMQLYNARPSLGL